MSFAEKHLRSQHSKDLTDDARHHHTEPLQASALADRSARDIGSLLHRVKYGTAIKKEFEGDVQSLVQLRGAWRVIVEKKGRERKWIKDADWPTMGALFPRMVEKIAAASLAYYLDDNCPTCGGTGSSVMLLTCKACAGTRKGKIVSTVELKLSDYEIKLAQQMADELLALEHTHAGVASVKLRREV
jgi:hypothetical protein